jgi:hypothetical protein
LAISVTSATFSSAVRLRDEIVELEDETDVLAAEASQRNVARRGEVVVEIVDLAAGRHIQARQEC